MHTSINHDRASHSENGRPEVEDELNAKDERLAVALAQGLSVRQAAKAAGISERTAHRRRKDLKLQRRVKALRHAQFQRVVGQISMAAQEAVPALCELLKSENESTRLQAVRIALQSIRLRDCIEGKGQTSRLTRVVSGFRS